ncbi:hypothetical protein QJS04_geneDACA015009 [Acorus gramineus]|uniref:Uncharacterized protein n=1 Tax=Acorus gramineus TaxID=55184 RepID=A0AAV9BY37_ACOGR|nr:hypothetical protein QJS04_geneDACA015009 [Acorus gramineus]
MGGDHEEEEEEIVCLDESFFINRNYEVTTFTMDKMVIDEAFQHGLEINEVQGTRTIVRNLEGVIFEMSLNSNCKTASKT